MKDETIEIVPVEPGNLSSCKFRKSKHHGHLACPSAPRVLGAAMGEFLFLSTKKENAQTVVNDYSAENDEESIQYPELPACPVCDLCFPLGIFFRWHPLSECFRKSQEQSEPLPANLTRQIQAEVHVPSKAARKVYWPAETDLTSIATFPRWIEKKETPTPEENEKEPLTTGFTTCNGCEGTDPTVCTYHCTICQDYTVGQWCRDNMIEAKPHASFYELEENKDQDMGPQKRRKKKGCSHIVNMSRLSTAHSTCLS